MHNSEKLDGHKKPQVQLKNTNRISICECELLRHHVVKCKDDNETRYQNQSFQNSKKKWRIRKIRNMIFQVWQKNIFDVKTWILSVIIIEIKVTIHDSP